MDAETKAALGRLRRLHDGVESGEVYREFPHPAKQRMVDELAVELFALAEHPADDDEPVTKEWLAAKGAIFHDVWRFYLPACELHVSFSPTGGMWLARLNQEDERYEYLNISDSVPTKRQVRRLVSALEGK